MKAAALQEHGGPEVLRYEDVAAPNPGPGQALVRVRSVSVNRSLDVSVRRDEGTTTSLSPWCSASTRGVWWRRSATA
jgi:NADPH:quinone reductase-like Zn-dependent oxidoreductase